MTYLFLNGLSSVDEFDVNLIVPTRIFLGWTAWLNG